MLLRFSRLHGALKAVTNLLITTVVVIQDGSAAPWRNALLIASFFQRSGIGVRGGGERSHGMVHQQAPRTRWALGTDLRWNGERRQRAA